MKSITDKQIKQWDFISKTLLKDNRSQYRLRDIGNKMFLSYNILDSDADVANNLSKPLTELDPVFLFRFLSSCVIDEELAEHSERLIKDLFKETEIKKYKNDKVMNIKKSCYPLVLNDVIQVNNDQWLCVIDMKTIFEMGDNQIIHYNPETQRQSRVVHTSAGTYNKIAVNKKSVTEITNLMKKGLFISNTITLNINADIVENNFYYDAENKSLILSSGFMDIIDGFHRYQAMLNAYKAKEDISFKTCALIVNFSVDKAKRYIIQEDKKNKINKAYIKTLDGSDLINMLISRLNETSYCATYGQINNIGKYNKTYMYSALERTYKKMKERSEVGDAAKELAKVINEYDDNMKLKNYSLLDLYIMCRASKDKKKIDYKKIKKEHNSALFNSKRANITSDMVNITDNYLI